MKKTQTHGDRQTDRQRRWGWVEWALWRRNLRTLEAQNVCFMQLDKKARILSTTNKEASILHTTKQGLCAITYR